VNARTLLCLTLLASAGVAPTSGRAASDLRSVAIVMSAGVQAPAYGALRPYAGRRWPNWALPAGSLTPHGALLVTALGASYRASYTRAGFLNAGDCREANGISVVTSDRPSTAATAAAFLAGLAPDCDVAYTRAPAGADPIFHPVPDIAKADPAAAAGSLRAALGSDPNGLTPGDAASLARLEALLDCAAYDCTRVSTLGGSIVTDSSTGLASLRGPVAVGGAAVDALRAEYAGALPAQNVGWGHLDLDLLRDLSQMSVLRARLEDRNPYAARVTASNLAAHVLASLTGRSGRLSAFVGLETNVAQLAGLLDATWSLPGDPRNDTPPGGALVFERYAADRRAGRKSDEVRIFFVAQPFGAMRRATPGSPVPVTRVPVAIAGCPDTGCPVETFEQLVKRAIDPAFVTPV
jgi:4-phytase/acid phosphatase